MWVQRGQDTLKIKISSVVSLRMVEQLRRERNTHLKLQTIFWKVPDLETESRQKSRFSFILLKAGFGEIQIKSSYNQTFWGDYK